MILPIWFDYYRGRGRRGARVRFVITPVNEREMSEERTERSIFTAWEEAHTSPIAEILGRLLSLQNLEDGKETGAFYYSTAEKMCGPFQTLEAILPFLLVPNRDEYREAVALAMEYVLGVGEADGGYRPPSEYKAWEQSAVDSTAFAVYVFVFAREFVRSLSYLDSTRDWNDLGERIDQKVIAGLYYLKTHRNPDNGWGLVKRRNFKSRVYSTSLTITALSQCCSDDFRRAEASEKDLIGRGVEFLVGCQSRSDNETRGGWYYSEDHKEITPNITAVACFGLLNSLRYNRAETTIQAIDLGVKYLVRHLDYEDRSEKVKVPVSGRKRGKTYEWHYFTHPFQMALSAALLSGELGYNDERIIAMKERILEDYRYKVAKYQANKWDEANALTGYELADIASNLTAFYSVANVVEDCSYLFASVKETINVFSSLREHYYGDKAAWTRSQGILRWSLRLLAAIAILSFLFNVWLLISTDTFVSRALGIPPEKRSPWAVLLAALSLLGLFGLGFLYEMIKKIGVEILFERLKRFSVRKRG